MKKLFALLFLALIYPCFPVSAEDDPITVIVIESFSDPDSDKTANTTTISKNVLKDRESTHLQDSLEIVPNLNWSAGTSRPRYFQIRGVGELEQYEGAFNPSVGLFLDDIDLSGFGNLATLFDIDRVQVLRGPQSVLWGQNALAGVIDLHSSEPTSEPNGKGEISLGSDELYSGGFASGGELFGNKDNTFRISAYHSQSNGFKENDFLNSDDTNNREETSVRAKLRSKLSPQTTLDFSTLYINADNGYDAFSIYNGRDTQTDQPGRDSLEMLGGALKISNELSEDLILQSLTTFTHTSSDYDFDGDLGNDLLWQSFLPFDFFSADSRSRNVFAEELRLRSDEEKYTRGRTYGWTSGVRFQSWSETEETHEFFDNTEFDFLGSDYDAKSIALFGELDTPIADNTSVTTGARIENRDSRYYDTKESSFDPNENLFAASVSLQHDLNERTTAYLLGSRGYRGGGFNPNPSVPESLRQFGDENIYNLETGIRAEIPEIGLQTKLSAFYARRNDQQIRLAIQDDPKDPLSFTFITSNAAKGETKGIEAEVEKKFSPTLTLYSSLGLLDAEFLEFSDGVRDLAGRDASHAPNWQYAIGAKLKITESVFFRPEVTGKDAFYFDDSHDQRSKSYHLTNATFGYLGDGWSWTVWGRNIFNQRYAVRGFYFGLEPPDFPNKQYVQLGDPRQIGTTLSFYF